MAQGFLAAIGSEHGPCEDEACGHAYCASGRESLEKVCRHCNEIIGADTGFFQDVPDGKPAWSALVHSLCKWKELDKARATTEGK